MTACDGLVSTDGTNEGAGADGTNELIDETGADGINCGPNCAVSGAGGGANAGANAGTDAGPNAPKLCETIINKKTFRNK